MQRLSESTYQQARAALDAALRLAMAEGKGYVKLSQDGWRATVYRRSTTGYTIHLAYRGEDA